MLPFCRPPGNKIHYNSENLGEVMRGDRIVNTPFQVTDKFMFIKAVFWVWTLLLLSSSIIFGFQG